MAKTKKTTVSIDQANELEVLLGDYADDYVPGIGNPARAVRDFFRVIACPQDVRDGVLTRMASLIEDTQICHQDTNRSNAESVAESYKRLDEYLTKHFNVTMPRKGQRPYTWSVGS